MKAIVIGTGTIGSAVKKALEERYQSGKNRWFFTPLRF